MTAVTPQGFVRTRLDERLAQLQDAMRAIFGPDINLDPDTVDGQTLGIFAESISNLDQLAEAVYLGFNPQTASDVFLSRLVQLNGIRRIPGAYSTVTLTCGGTQGTTIPAGSLVKHAATGATFQTMADAVIGGSGTVDVAAQATSYGPTQAPAGTLTKIDTPLYGWQTVTNAADAIPGRFEETDEQLRVRRALSTATPAQSIVDSIYGAIANLPQVRAVKVWENPTHEVDALGLPPHSIYTVVEGGTDAEIGQMLWLKKTAGTTLVGTTAVAAIDTMGNPHDMKFSRPAYTDVFVTVNLSLRPGWPSDGEARIKQAIVDWALANQDIGEEVTQSRLYDPVNSVPGHSVSALLISAAANPTQSANIPVAFDGLARFDTGRIVVSIA